jgi:hypothetical protein
MLCLHGLSREDLPKYVALGASITDPIDHLAPLGYTAFKCISRRNFLPLELPPCPEQVRFEQTLERLYTPDIFMRIRRAVQRRVEVSVRRLRTVWRRPARALAERG